MIFAQEREKNIKRKGKYSTPNQCKKKMMEKGEKKKKTKKKAEGNSANGMSCIIGKEADKGNKNE